MTSGIDPRDSALTPVSPRDLRRSPAMMVPATPSRRASRPDARWSRRRGVLGVFAVVAAVGFAAASVGPTSFALTAANAEPVPVTLYASAVADAQSLDASGSASGPQSLDRGGYSVFVKPKPTPTPTAAAATDKKSGAGWSPPFVSPNPGSAQAIAYEMVKARGWGDDQFSCLVALWQRESGWRVNAYNPSGAYGIPQALPGSKMASAGADWETNPATQISWGLGYISGRYANPCGAWAKSNSSGWY